METEIKLLKDREVDQKNKASGYETLLRDGIPLNEHFLALKNKYNNENDSLLKAQNGLQDEINKERMNNDAKRERIDILKSEHDTISKKLNASRDLNSRNVRDLETKLYSETHTKNLLTDEKKKLNAVLNVLR
jgi:Skp family chaperone for outer membrane proteins